MPKTINKYQVGDKVIAPEYTPSDVIYEITKVNYNGEVGETKLVWCGGEEYEYEVRNLATNEEDCFYERLLEKEREETK